jgi:hypothetical protein
MPPGTSEPKAFPGTGFCAAPDVLLLSDYASPPPFWTLWRFALVAVIRGNELLSDFRGAGAPRKSLNAGDFLNERENVRFAVASRAGARRSGRLAPYGEMSGISWRGFCDRNSGHG